MRIRGIVFEGIQGGNVDWSWRGSFFCAFFEGGFGVCMGVVLGSKGMGRDAPVCASFRGLGSIGCSW